METFDLYFAGEFHKGDIGLNIVNPYTKKVFAKTWLATKQHLDAAIEKALQIEKQAAELPVYVRSNALKYIADKIYEQRERFTWLISMEAAKPHVYAMGEVMRAVQTFTIASEEAKRIPKEYISLDWTKAGHGKEGIVKYFPIGLVAGISPFNFPLNLAVHKIAPAIAVGNPIILKPSRNTPLSTLELAKIISQTELPAGMVSILPMDRESGNQLVTDERFKLLSFTGSPVVGWKMKRNAGRKKVLLELGGNAGVYVSQSADLDLALRKTVVGAFAYSGQVCIHAQRIYVNKNIFDKFAEMFVKAASELKFGDPTDPNTEISAMIDEENAIRVEQWVKEAVADGAKILIGGKRDGAYYPATVLTETHKDMKVCALEVFGPVVTLEPVDSIEQAVDYINDSQYGLQAGIFTDSFYEMNYAFNNLHVGGVIINDVPTFRVDHMPYGGVKNSGFGREGIKYSIMEMTEPRLLVMPNYSS